MTAGDGAHLVGDEFVATWRIIAVSKWLATPIWKPWSLAIWKGSHVARSLGDENDHHGYEPRVQVMGWSLQVKSDDLKLRGKLWLQMDRELARWPPPMHLDQPSGDMASSVVNQCEV